MAAAKPAATASCPSERWLVPLTRFCRKRSKARCSASRISTCMRYRVSRVCSPISSLMPARASSVFRADVIAIHARSTGIGRPGRAEISPSLEAEATLLGGDGSHLCPVRDALAMQDVKAGGNHDGCAGNCPAVRHVAEHQKPGYGYQQKLSIDEGRQDGGWRQSMCSDQEVMAETSDRAGDHHQGD